MSHKVFSRSFYKSPFPQKFVDLFFALVIVKDNLTEFVGSCLLQNDFKTTLCEIR